MPIQFAGNEYSVVNGNYQSAPRLPKGVYNVNFKMFQGFVLHKQGDNFILPEKLYGDFKDIAYWKRYSNSVDTNTGIFLCGYKGTGKTIEAKKFCNETGKPVIIINQNFGEHNHALMDFLARPEFDDCIVFIDEFEKHFPDSGSEIFLGLMDGTMETNLTFVLTANKENISEYLQNRLGRIRYRKVYDSLDVDVIDEVLDDMLDNERYKSSVKTLFHMMGICTFDLLTNVVKEVNLFNEDALTCAKRLNLKTEQPQLSGYIYINGNKTPFRLEEGTYDLAKIYSAPSRDSEEEPLTEEFYITHHYDSKAVKSFIRDAYYKFHNLIDDNINSTQKLNEPKPDFEGSPQLQEAAQQMPILSQRNPGGRASARRRSAEKRELSGELQPPNGGIKPRQHYVSNDTTAQFNEYINEHLGEYKLFKTGLTQGEVTQLLSAFGTPDKVIDGLNKAIRGALEDVKTFDKDALVKYYHSPEHKNLLMRSIINPNNGRLTTVAITLLLGDVIEDPSMNVLDILQEGYFSTEIHNEDVSTWKSDSTKINIHEVEEVEMDVVLSPSKTRASHSAWL